ncbi:MAG: type II and III secretion system protein family protein [Alphaproteobacteria bacterium]
MLLTFARRMMMAALVIVGASGLYNSAEAQIVISGAQTAPKDVAVGLNKSLVIDLPRDARDILVSNPAIADAIIRTPRRIYVTGIAVGQSNVIIFDRSGQQIVSLELRVERDPSRLAQLLRRLLPTSDIEVEIVSDNIILSGSVRNAADARRAEDIAGIFANGGANAQPSSTSSSSSSSGGVSISLGSDKAPTSAIINMLAIEGEDQVHLKVTVAEVQRNIAKQLGLELSGSLSIASIVGDIVTQNPFAIANKALSSNAISGGVSFDASNSLKMTMRALEQTGMIRTLAEPTLTAISGESASFLAGGEFPVPTGRDSTGQISIEFKPFGVALSFTPVVLSEGRISLRVKTEVSELSAEGAFVLSGTGANELSIPGLKVRRAESTMELPSGGSMVLGGLIQDSVRQSIGQVPGLGKLPILGPLFRSRDFQRNETELVIIVTPYLVKPVARTALVTPDQGFGPASDSQSIFLGNINRVYGAQTSTAQSGSYSGRVGFIYD